MSATASLADVPVGQWARVSQVDEAEQPRFALRLRQLGLRPGTQVQVVRRAPWGGPAVYRLHGYELCLRAQQAAHVLVTTGAADTGDAHLPLGEEPVPVS